MGKHDLGTPINESLERHYQEEKKRLEAKVASLEEELNEAKLTIERYKTRVRLKNVQIETLAKFIPGGDEDEI